MNRYFGTCALTALALGLTACASGGTGPDGDGPEPLIDPATGTVAAPRNLVMEDISFRSGTSGRGVDETYDLSTHTLTVDRADNGARTFAASTRSGFGTGQSMSYDADTNRFSFAIDHARDGADPEAGPRIVMSEAFGPLLTVTPQEVLGLENGVEAVYLAAQTVLYPGVPVSVAGNVAAADRYLTQLSESDDAQDAVRREAIGDVTADIAGGPGFYYEANGVVYYQYRTDGNVAPTRFVAAGEWDRANADGTQDFSHLVYGQRTEASEMPQTGTASYDGTIYGHINRENTVRGLRGGFGMETDFASGDVEMSMDANIAYRNGQGQTLYIDYAEFTGNGSLDDTTFDGRMSGTIDRDVVDGTESRALTGSFDGAFFGPTAQEIGGTFEFTGDDAVGVGSFVGRDRGSNETGD